MGRTDIASIRAELAKVRKAPTAVLAITEMARDMIEEQSPAQKSIGKYAILLLTYLKTPITLESLAEALAMVEDKANGQVSSHAQLKERLPGFDTIVESCVGLITVTPGSNEVTLVRLEPAQSVESLWSQLFQGEGQKYVVLALLNYLLLPDFAGGACSSSNDLKNR